MYMELLKLHECGFNTWVSKALNLVQEYGININIGSTTCLNRYCKSHIYNQFKISWKDEVQNIDKNPILKNYKTFKSEFGMEPYLHLIADTDCRLTEALKLQKALNPKVGRISRH